MVTIFYDRYIAFMKSKNEFDVIGYSLLAATVAISVLSFNSASGQFHTVNVFYIWYYGWVTAICTALGVIPFFFVSTPNKYWMGISNGTQFTNIG